MAHKQTRRDRLPNQFEDTSRHTIQLVKTYRGVWCYIYGACPSLEGHPPLVPVCVALSQTICQNSADPPPPVVGNHISFNSNLSNHRQLKRIKYAYLNNLHTYKVREKKKKSDKIKSRVQKCHTQRKPLRFDQYA